MKVAQLGSGTPEIAVVAGVHGDEPCGVRAVERLLDERPAVKRPVKLIVANEKALERQVRFVDEDLNRAFPGDPDAKTHEAELASELVNELDDCLAFSMHSTQSHAEPFAIVNEITERATELCPQLPVAAMVETSMFAEGRLFSAAQTIEVECGLQGTETAAENADRLTRAFLTAVGALPGDTVQRDLPVFRLTDVIQKEQADTYEVFVDNFTKVPAGDPFAAADGETQIADEAFYPILMSSNGYEDVFGYTAEKLDILTTQPIAD
ncbi:succinylglutamate desuccinylase/aspartoacylase family protein [Natrialba magadii ATCC 43099]|uniref:Succinylglutamate desuccinylase/aspartoacylase n=1 Tax=Natrialba magadii (strain ATCC 43099 / DSM 3394 / CCM 3739 / CIP 104546 / IAM 13178 / JCM 8861 / NBRC 102185 / NCIMB 2190 / MS3) TaxID=547559 RepID=D3SZD4_NATMM|nr:succinylglutamate desuccinylase/aspartoacylase family protein [Natrialba magadii]ADD04268.1 succinylglutamate desuccinylase/aspartoacylase family protein [Natrialba magadii ATCC 43099]ELY26671.1 succinylglutamate desuccinylase/aspartoacylase [Natrialba magadii ATCC 43099]